MKSYQLLTWLLIALSFQASLAANILFFFQKSPYSHQTAVWPLVEALADRGHSVTFHSFILPKEQNSKVKVFSSKSVRDWFSKEGIFSGTDVLDFKLRYGQLGPLYATTKLFPSSVRSCQAFLDDPETVGFIKNSNEKFDLVVIDHIVNDCGYGVAGIFRAKTIVVVTTHPSVWIHDPFAIVQESSTIPEYHTAFPIPMNFFQRVFSTLIPPLLYQYKAWIYYPQLDALFASKFGDMNLSRIQEIERETSLVLYNSHFSEELARSLPPMFVSVGGMHLDWGNRKKKPRQIPSHIQQWIDGAGDEGFVYVSFGSVVKVETASPAFQHIFYTAFANSKLRFLWKWEGKRPLEMPPNVFTAQWMPQQEILASKNCKAFLTHGGLLSIQEAISYAVPMIVLPVFAEQDYNAIRVARLGRGIRLDTSTVTAEDLQDALNEILRNPMYNEKVEEARSVFMDRPQYPLETAIYWTEYVLRHNDTSSLKPIYAMQQYWFQWRLLDVWAFVFTSLSIGFYLLFLSLKKMICWTLKANKNSRSLGDKKPKVKTK